MTDWLRASSSRLPRRIALLGSTGSIGTSTLDVVASHPERLSVVALAAGRNRDLLLAQCEIFKPACVSVSDEPDAAWLRAQLSYSADIHFGSEGLLACALSPEVDVSGITQLRAQPRRIGFIAHRDAGGFEDLALGELLPVDSEHAALHQLLDGRNPKSVREVRITASGGPFRQWPLEKIQTATREEALNHPTWKMGPKITIDSATLMNKGLEVIEASVLFGLKPDQIQVTVHPQSQVHAMVGFHDGTYQLQVSANDMKLPIQYTLLYPDHLPGPVAPYDWAEARAWTFEAPDLERFPCLGLAYAALHAGGTAPAILNAANEVAVEAFLEGRIGFWDIQACNAEVLGRLSLGPADSLEAVLAADRNARDNANSWIASR